ncbi:unnamed protein product [Protopolystoma xenopodis]|uniref:Uncharacterized protein n=1 Tax=Protopolystoma xenopodis TaxID=117903 RepID=A0A3S5BBV5_9PLAT|nr:unnamed protein product [Protopolystoma xenopodis]
MTKLTDDADYDASETLENVPSRLSDVGNHDNTMVDDFGLGIIFPFNSPITSCHITPQMLVSGGQLVAAPMMMTAAAHGATPGQAAYATAAPGQQTTAPTAAFQFQAAATTTAAATGPASPTATTVASAAATTATTAAATGRWGDDHPAAVANSVGQRTDTCFSRMANS